MKIDKLDLEIIKHLQDDARLSFRKLGKTLGIPHTTVFTRAERLVEKGIINRFSAILHPHDLGLQMGFIVLDAAPSESKRIAQKLSAFPEANMVFRTFDGKIISKIVVPNQKPHAGLEEFLTKLNGCPFTAYPIHDVVKFESSIHPDLIKTLSIYSDK
ncbi:MAG: Lrp/AsnC family transcriptional regulator [Candidatus Altiarchaeota archaeon]|nr:Lrp/AsnC family transcriptional regulator [Candidatus Altiarchaeota archaeon]